MSDSPITIAGEPLEILEKGLPAIKTQRLPDGWYRVTIELEGEIFASWQRAIERYAADLVRPGNIDPIEKRYADALVRLVLDISDALADSPT